MERKGEEERAGERRYIRLQTHRGIFVSRRPVVYLSPDDSRDLNSFLPTWLHPSHALTLRTSLFQQGIRLKAPPDSLLVRHFDLRHLFTRIVLALPTELLSSSVTVHWH